MKDNDQAID